MDTRYQVFVSSTFLDLVAERQVVLSAILELSHMPAGMELFPAGDDAAWRLIQDVIDSSDYYVLIVGGRYGSLDEAGIGFTEKEYDYAIATSKPVIPLLHANPDNLPRDKTETDDAAWEKLKQFRAKVEKRHHCVYWQTVDELKAKAIIGLTSTMKRHPAIGWVRADQVVPEASLKEVIALQRRVAELEAERLAATDGAPKGTEELSQGEDEHIMRVSFTAHDPKDVFRNRDQRFDGRIATTWNELFAAIAPSMINEVLDSELRNAVGSFGEQRTHETFDDDGDLADKTIENISVNDEDVATCLVQFRALGLIRESQKPRSVKDTRTYWSLTPYGDHVMTQLRAIRRADATHSE